LSEPIRFTAVDRRWFLAGLAVLLFGLTCYRSAWLCDDAYITFRTIDNCTNGFGLRWNVLERVQSYTHPLWLLLQLPFHAVIREIYYTSLWLSLAFSVATIGLVLRAGASRLWGALIAVTALGLSRTFVDYSSSGLENPLTHLLLALFFLLYWRTSHHTRSLFWLACCAGLVTLNRLDLSLLILPPLLCLFWRLRSRRRLAVLVLGFLPLVLWELFSLWYYGFPFPNTAYAKLTTGLTASELAGRGCLYLAS